MITLLDNEEQPSGKIITITLAVVATVFTVCRVFYFAAAGMADSDTIVNVKTIADNSSAESTAKTLDKIINSRS